MVKITLGYFHSSSPVLGDNGIAYYLVNTDSDLNKAKSVLLSIDYKNIKKSPYYSSPLATKPLWVTDIGTSTLYSRMTPSIGRDGTIYVGNNDGEIVATNPDGKIKWRKQLSNKPIVHPVTIASDGKILIFSKNNNEKDILTALTTDGKVVWNYSEADYDWFGEYGDYTPSVSNEGIIYLTDRYGLHAITSEGKKLWYFKAKSTIMAGSIIDNNGIVYFSDNHYVYAVNPSGTEKWSYQYTNASGHPSSISLGSDGTIYLMFTQYLVAIGNK